MDDTEKYPPNIQKLFGPKPPFLYIPPTDYPPEQRSTTAIAPISSIKDHISSYITQYKSEPKPTTSTTISTVEAFRQKKQRHQESFTRQLAQWNDPELFAKNEREFMKDPYRTVFIARLDYSVTELDISSAFSKYGVIESIRIIRDKNGKSRGYGFIVFERTNDAKNCVNELCRSGILLKNRHALVDFERGRIIRNWKPRRLGGGEGGRGYTAAGRKASAAATARRVHIANNPGYTPSYIPQTQYGNGYRPQQQPQESPVSTSIKDKYAKYTSATTTTTSANGVTNYKSTSGDRSIRSIRHRE
ncbi:uncharacterized protein SPAPADRAFT_60375 [Spathaspora passalidarum NRRL Y-27907]|uniref:RRM domain-containing protein n=1 Tax=Spathaspora passalidarum (strain NRRL Y-27907 / 11-Y1) TaxID=619300 RepID=G3AL15_SPAPN|nr:uncharacterized protein SPAPADRAFT_60375 [Spathaspora passalidarum NRRL Y-27907]EGW33058.1 hypothetical protein SPAPADRAFT_60375 [Spathaspora passalidarum NRRL Y-27907]